MSVKYRPVQWNINKYVYDILLVAGVFAYILIFIAVGRDPDWAGQERIGVATLRIRAFGSCAFLMLTLILCIGPLARLDRRFLPLLYNRRHFGVMCFFVALGHALYVLGWYQAFSPTPPLVALMSTNTAYDSLVGFPFESLGILALLILFAMAATSHDFWLKFLTPSVWKTLHMGAYVAYAAVVMHVVLGLLQSEFDLYFAALTVVSTGLVVALHLVAGRRESALDRQGATPAREAGWVAAADIGQIAEGHGLAVTLPNGERAAIFRYDGQVSVLSNLCAHQNGPLGEGRIIDGCVTCPWHGFQYCPRDGRSPPPFTEMVPTFNVRLEGTQILIDPRPNPAGTEVTPARIEREP